MLEHADRDDAIEALVQSRGSPQLEAATRSATPAAFARSTASACCSFDSVTPEHVARPRSARDRSRAHPSRSRCRAPAAPACRSSLAAISRHLLRCGCLERIVVMLEVGARVEQPLVQEQAVELVADVVVVGDVLLRPADRVRLLEALELARDTRRAPSAMPLGAPDGRFWLSDTRLRKSRRLGARKRHRAVHVGFAGRKLRIEEQDR